MRRELVNRITSVIGFQPLDRENLARILDQIIATKARAFEVEKGLMTQVDQSARRVLLESGYSPELGARPLERAVDELVVQPLVDAWFANQLRTGPVRFTAAVSAKVSSQAGTIIFSQD